MIIRYSLKITNYVCFNYYMLGDDFFFDEKLFLEHLLEQKVFFARTEVSRSWNIFISLK